MGVNGALTAFEIGGTIDVENRLALDEPLPVAGPRRVRVIVLFGEDEDWDDATWLRAAASSPSFDFLADTAEDIYSLTDGVPFRDEV